MRGTGLIRFRIGIIESPCECGIELPCSISHGVSQELVNQNCTIIDEHTIFILPQESKECSVLNREFYQILQLRDPIASKLGMRILTHSLPQYDDAITNMIGQYDRAVKGISIFMAHWRCGTHITAYIMMTMQDL